MTLVHSLIAASYHPARKFNFLLKRVGVSQNSRLRIINYHDIAPNQIEIFKRQIEWISRSWKFVTPWEFAKMIKGEYPIVGSNVLLTFDDGFISGYTIAMEVLKSMNIKAVYFIVTDFVNVAGGTNFKEFVAKNIYPNLSPEEVPNHWSSMTWDNLSWLCETGHSIGTHSSTHARLSTLKKESDLEVEICDSIDILERKLGINVDHFAYPFGNLKSFSSEALKVARKRLTFIHTGLRGDNACGTSSWALRRDDIQPRYSINLIGSFLEGVADIHYKRDIAVFESWGK